MRYLIPLVNLGKLQKQVNSIRRKGADVTFDIINDRVEVEDDNNPDIITICAEVEIDGHYQVEGWSFAGVIEHTPNGNIIRTIGDEFDGRIPEHYRTDPAECEHCHIRRPRGDTFLVYNEHDDEFKQVGSTCLNSYTNGLDANTCALMASFVKDVNESDNENFDRGLAFEDFIGWGNSYELNGESAKAIAFDYVKNHGYEKGGVTSRKVGELCFKAHPEVPSVENELLEMDEWVEALPTNNDYYWNAKMAWKKDSIGYKDLGLICSLISIFLKEKAERQANANNPSNEWVGEIGERRNFNIVNSRIIYEKAPVSYYADPTYVTELKDDEGHTLIWSTSTLVGRELEKKNPLTIIARIKDHKEYRGVKQTIIANGKII